MSSLFPELNGAEPSEPDRDSRDDDRDRPIVKLALGPAHRAWRGGAYSLESYRTLLGLPAPDPQPGAPAVTRAQVLLGDGRIELCIESPELGKVTLWLVPCRPSRSNPTNFRVMLQGEVPNEAVRRLLEITARRLHRAPYRVLLKVFRKDPERQDVATAFQPVVNEDRPRSGDDWASTVPTPELRKATEIEPQGAQDPPPEPVAPAATEGQDEAAPAPAPVPDATPRPAQEDRAFTSVQPPAQDDSAAPARAEAAPEPPHGPTAPLEPAPERPAEPPAGPDSAPERPAEPSAGPDSAPERPAEPPAGPDGAPEPSRPSFDAEWDELFARSVVRTHAGPLAWRVFFAELEQQRNFNHRLTGSILVVRHEDLECCYATPPMDDGSYSFIHYSTIHSSERETSWSEEERPQPDHEERSWGEVATDMDDLDVIKGGAYRVEQALDAVAELDERPDLLMVKTACVPVVIGDDLGAAMARFEDRTGVPTVYLDNLADDQSDFFSTILDRLRWEPEFREPGQTIGRLNLVGFPDTPAMERLVSMLERLGVVINARLVPEIRLSDMKRYTWAQLQVFFDSKLYYPTFQQLFGNVDIPSLRTTPPYGVQGSRSWLADVAAALNRTDGLAELWSSEWSHFAERWSERSAQASAYRLGFVIDPRTARMLLQPSRGTGVPMLAMLQEMGFELEFLYFASDGAEPDPALPGPCSTFRNPSELESLLRRSEAAAYYSEYTFDRRLSRCGKAQFSVADFRLGLEGALDTLTRLLRVCSMSFYRRYCAYLGEPFGSLGEPDQEQD